MSGQDEVSAPKNIEYSTQVTEARRYHIEADHPSSGPLKVLCGGCERTRSDYEIMRMTFPSWCIEFVAEGAGTLMLQGKSYELRPGVAFSYGPSIPHEIRTCPRQVMLKYYVDFAGTQAAKSLKALVIGTRPVQISRPSEIQHIFESLQRDSMEPTLLRGELCAAHLRVLLLKIEHRSMLINQDHSRSLAAYDRARRLIEEHFLEINSAEEVASKSHITPAYLSRLFSRYAKVTPYAYLIRLKMNRAAELLMDEGLMVKEVADRLHFPTPFQFSRTFKRIYRISPEHFVRRNPRSATASQIRIDS